MVLLRMSSSSIPVIWAVETPWTTMPYFGLCTASSLNAVSQLTSCRRSLASSGDLHCSRIPFVILLIPFIFGLSVAFDLSMVFWHCSVILRACIVFSFSIVSLFDVVRMISYGSHSFLSFSCISQCLTCAWTMRGVASVFVFATALA